MECGGGGISPSEQTFIWHTERIYFEFIGKMPKDSTSNDAASNAELSAELSKLRRVCGGHKAYSTKTLTQTSTILDGFQSSDSLKLRQNKKVLEEKIGIIR